MGQARPDHYDEIHKHFQRSFRSSQENRGLSVREGATLQTFPKNYVFPAVSIGVAAKIIGNAVPPRFAKRLAETIRKAHSDLEHG